MAVSPQHTKALEVKDPSLVLYIKPLTRQLPPSELASFVGWWGEGNCLFIVWIPTLPSDLSQNLQGGGLDASPNWF